MDKLNMLNPFNLGELIVEGIQSKSKEMFIELINSFLDVSYEVCLIVGLIGAILYLFGCQKTKSVPILAPVIYLIIKILSSVLLGV